VRATYALLLGENQQADEGAKLLQANLKGTAADRELYLNISQIYERSHRYQEAEEMARKAEALPGEPRENEMTWFCWARFMSARSSTTRPKSNSRKC